MTERITQSMLDSAIKNLNAVTKSMYVSNDCYGWSQLAAKSMNSGGGIHGLSHGNSKKELYYQIQFYLDIMRHEKDSRNWVKNCRHRDEFNSYDGKKNISVVSERDGKFYCGGCEQEITKEDYIKSCKPITKTQLRKEVNA